MTLWDTNKIRKRHIASLAISLTLLLSCGDLDLGSKEDEANTSSSPAENSNNENEENPSDSETNEENNEQASEPTSASLAVSGTLKIGSEEQKVLALPVVEGGIFAQSSNDISSATPEAGAFVLPINTGASLTEDGKKITHVIMTVEENEDPLAEAESIKFINVPAGNGESAIDLQTNLLKKDMELGEIVEKDGELLSQNSLSEDDFDLSLKALQELATTDDTLRKIKNDYINSDLDEGTYIRYGPKFMWKGLFSNVIDKASSPEDLSFLSYGLWFDAKRDDFTLEKICHSSSPSFQSLRLVPPEQVFWMPESENVSLQEISNVSANEIVDSPQMSGRKVCSASDNSGGPFQAYQDASDPRVSFAFQGMTGKVPSGFWDLFLGDKKVGRFDVASGHPFRGDIPIIYVPSLKLNYDSSTKKLLSMEVELYLYDFVEKTYKKILDLDTFMKISTEFTVEFQDIPDGRSFLKVNEAKTKFEAKPDFDKDLTTEDSSVDDTTAKMSRVDVEYNLYGTYYRFEFR